MSYDARPRAPCAHVSCNSLSIVRVRAMTGWANLCINHYASQHDERDRRYCHDLGLDTTEKKIAHCRELFRKPRSFRAWMESPKSEAARQYRDDFLRDHPTGFERQPGEDDE